MSDIDTSINIQEAVAPHLNQWGPYRLSRDEVNEVSIRYYCEVAEDANPVYWDEEYAKTTQFGRLIAPPQQMLTLTIGAGGWWTPDHVAEKTAADAAGYNESLESAGGGEANRIVSAHGYTTGTATNSEVEFLAPFGPGDGRLKIRSCVTSVSEVKRTRVGEGVFLTMVDEVSTEFGGKPIGKVTLTLLFYDSSKPRE